MNFLSIQVGTRPIAFVCERLLVRILTDRIFTPIIFAVPVLDKLFKNTDNNKGQAVRSVLQEALLQENVTNPRQLLTNCIYLEDSVVTLFGLKIYGAPW